MRHGHACGRVLRDVRRAPVGAARRRPGLVAHRRIRGGTGRARAAVVHREYVVPAPASPLARIVSGGDGAVVPGDGRLRAAALASAVGRGQRARTSSPVRSVHARDRHRRRSADRLADPHCGARRRARGGMGAGERRTRRADVRRRTRGRRDRRHYDAHGSCRRGCHRNPHAHPCCCGSAAAAAANPRVVGRLCDRCPGRHWVHRGGDAHTDGAPIRHGPEGGYRPTDQRASRPGRHSGCRPPIDRGGPWGIGRRGPVVHAAHQHQPTTGDRAAGGEHPCRSWFFTPRWG